MAIPTNLEACHWPLCRQLGIEPVLCTDAPPLRYCARHYDQVILNQVWLRKYSRKYRESLGRK